MYWRQSYGLLGIILGVQFKLEYRNKFTTQYTTYENVNSEIEFNKIMRATKENKVHGEYFIDPV